MASLAEELLFQIDRHRCDDGGFSQFGKVSRGTAYGCFLALGAYQELAGTDTAAGLMDGVPSRGGPCPPYILQCLQSLRTADGAYANEPAQACGMTSATAAACIVLRQMNQPTPSGVADWLLARREQGGFLASPAAPIPDLLSTATALHALAGMGVPTATMAESVSTFVTSLLCEDGGFRGNWLERNSDCEYTFYALLALGTVSLRPA
ncbi:MAG: hypothetical protein EHM48_08225 [Planctomycetaceae bacterium]|nr:MAG: hypothetical protein EHM48_08225 [Planctomycetaceae bacterium]